VDWAKTALFFLRAERGPGLHFHYSGLAAAVSQEPLNFRVILVSDDDYFATPAAEPVDGLLDFLDYGAGGINQLHLFLFEGVVNSRGNPVASDNNRVAGLELAQGTGHQNSVFSQAGDNFGVMDNFAPAENALTGFFFSPAG